MRILAVIDDTAGAGEREARALAAFLRDGLSTPAAPAPTGSTAVLCSGASDVGRLEKLTVAGDALPVPAVALRGDLTAAAIETVVRDSGADLVLAAGGPEGDELVARLAARSGGAALTGVLGAEAGPTTITCRRLVYSGHLTGCFDLGPPPWFLSVDAGWAGASGGAPDSVPDVARSASGAPGGEAGSPFSDVEWLAPPETGDLEGARFLVIAGAGAGSRDGAQRLAAAARRMGAAFGVTRPVAMNAWAPMDRLVGVSGTRTAPAVCIVAGAHGAPAFLWGVERAGFIAAVNVDEHAPIVAAADAAVLGDGVAVVEALADLVAGERS